MSTASPGDPFDGLLDLEERFYNEGYQEGVADGSRAGRIEGRLFGLEKGFEKFAAMGKLHGKAVIWTERLKRDGEPATTQALESTSKASQVANSTPQLAAAPEDGDVDDAAGKSPSSIVTHANAGSVVPQVLSPLPNSERLGRHVRTLYALTEPATFSTQNDEDSVADFDDRFKRAEAKARLIENTVGDRAIRYQGDTKVAGTSPGPKRKVAWKGDEVRDNSNIEDFGKTKSGG